MPEVYQIILNDQLFVNSKWYFDVLSVEGDTVKVRIKYYEGTDKNRFIYRPVKLPLILFKNAIKDSYIVRVNVVERDLKLQIGGLINRLVIEDDITKITEDMGAVSSPGLSGVVGTQGSFGSGDLASSSTSGSIKFMPKNEFGLEIVSKRNRKHIKDISKKRKGNLLRTPLLNLTKENTDSTNTNTDNDYKNSVFTFLDYPTDNQNDHEIMNIISEYRAEFLNTSAERIVQYFKDLYDTNKAFITNKCSDWFQNSILILAKI